MRAAFARTLAHLADSDPRILLLTGDLGYMALEPFADRHPGRFINAGVAEQNMIGVATGLAESGYIPFVYSIVTFASLRGYEFIRNGPVVHHLPVRIVGVGGGFEYGHNGVSHFGLEDVAVMRAQPGIRVIVPADHEQAANALLATWDASGPVYYRLGKDDKAIVPGLNGRFETDHVQLLGQGTDVMIVTMGSLATEVVAAAAELESASSIRATVAIVDQFNASTAANLAGHLGGFSLIVTAEAHYLSGGLGSFVAETIAEGSIRTRLIRCGVREDLSGETGTQKFMHAKHGLTAGQIADAARSGLQ